MTVFKLTRFLSTIFSSAEPTRQNKANLVVWRRSIWHSIRLMPTLLLAIVLGARPSLAVTAPIEGTVGEYLFYSDRII
ncbi:hypothetical protein [Breoghania sp.]|uniref:hypothetical protein n=1 Tax=Breoghania sp. TaxID=2065378 RepID=UPI0026065CB5|nr:hypothetical protein [Breoghania sp.]MDJ0932724.1 hypothetical protein [Breoghania sp.]